MEKEMSTVIVDARSRAIEASACSATQLAETEEIVLRKGVGFQIGDLVGKTIEFPILVAGSYHAQSSAGFTWWEAGSWARRVSWVGGCGFPHLGYPDKGNALRRFRSPINGAMIPAGAVIREVKTHDNSNGATADAASAGLSLMVKYNNVILAEGQSDRIAGWEIYHSDIKSSGEISFPEEHQKKVFFPDPVPDEIEETIPQEV